MSEIISTKSATTIVFYPFTFTDEEMGGTLYLTAGGQWFLAAMDDKGLCSIEGAKEVDDSFAGRFIRSIGEIGTRKFLTNAACELRWARPRSSGRHEKPIHQSAASGH